jgi:hypothetical protein
VKFLKDDIVEFDYGALTPKIAKAAKNAAARIRTVLNLAATDVGRDLFHIKGKLGHGQFGAWLHAEFGLTARTAQRYMTTARLAEKCDTVSQLPASALYALGAPSTPITVQDDMLARVEAGEKISKADVVKAIGDLKVSDIGESKNAANRGNHKSEEVFKPLGPKKGSSKGSASRKRDPHNRFSQPRRISV